jgi:hypothetical protein
MCAVRAHPIAIFGRPGLDQYTCVCVLRNTNNRATLHLLIRVARVGNTLWVFRVHTRKECPLTVHVDDGDAWATEHPSEWDSLALCVQSMCPGVVSSAHAASLMQLQRLARKLRRALVLVRWRIPQIPGHLWDDICLRALPSWALHQPPAQQPLLLQPPVTAPATAAPL